MQTSRWPISKLPIAHLEPFPYHKGEMYVELLDRLAKYVTKQLHPNLRKTVEHLIEELEQILALQHGKYVEGIQDFQRIHDAFMEDVNSALMALNDSAVTDLVNDPGSSLGGVIHDLVNEDKDTTHIQRSHLHYGIHDLDTLRAAIREADSGITITLPQNMVFELGHEPLEFTKPLRLTGGIFYADSIAFNIETSGVVLEDMSIHGPGSSEQYRPNEPAINVMGRDNQYIDFSVRNVDIYDQVDGGIRAEFVRDFTIRDVKVDRFRYGGIMLVSAEQGIVDNCVVQYANQPENLSYGIAVTDRLNTPEYRSRDVVVSNNRVHSIPEWEGLDTHGGYNISFINNTITACRNAIVMGVGTDTRRTAPEKCRAIGNFIDGEGKTPLSPANGILLGGSGAENPLRLFADAIVVGNTIMNCTVATNVPNRMSRGHSVRSQRIDLEKSVAYGNGGDHRQWITSDGGRYNYMESTFETGWRDAREYGEYAQGFAYNSQWPLEIKSVGDHTGVTHYLRGSVSILSSNPPESRVVFKFTDPDLIHQSGANGAPIGYLVENTSQTAVRVMVLYPNGELAHSFPSDPLENYATITATWRL